MDVKDLPKDILVLLALDLDVESVLNLCLSSKKINRKVCENRDFWRSRLKKDFPMINLKSGQDPKQIYLSWKRLERTEYELLKFAISDPTPLLRRVISLKEEFRNLLLALNPTYLNIIYSDYISTEPFNEKDYPGNTRQEKIDSIIDIAKESGVDVESDWGLFNTAFISQLEESSEEKNVSDYYFDPFAWHHYFDIIYAD